MLATSEITDRLADGLAAVHSRGAISTTALEDWLSSISARELLQVDQAARSWRYGNTLGPSSTWNPGALRRSGPVGAALASMHGDGHVREAAVHLLSGSDAVLADRMLAVRLSDHVRPVREAAVKALLGRTSLAQADHIMPVLQLIEGRVRGAEVLPLYLHALSAVHGEAALWSRLRLSTSREVRRAAFQHSLTNGLLATNDAAAALLHEPDRLVQSLLARLIADTAAPDVIASALLHDRSPHSRVLGLVRLSADLLDPADLERLLVDPESWCACGRGNGGRSRVGIRARLTSQPQRRPDQPECAPARIAAWSRPGEASTTRSRSTWSAAPSRRCRRPACA
ncbi:hypothetical protein [Promicromonospora sp. NPDC019610]|uniref:hypothetical protein n=1 Tax=Promicromonospora sp. NPDC019610 TaxID=3364405 RepID=UPI003794EB18